MYDVFVYICRRVTKRVAHIWKCHYIKSSTVTKSGEQSGYLISKDALKIQPSYQKIHPD
jgi:hypothetical protein